MQATHSLLAATCVTLIATPAAWGAATVGVYDSPSNLNQVDASATSDANLLTNNEIGVATFTANVAAAFNADLGGVINFEDTSGIDPVGTNDTIVATYGVNQSNSITITGAFASTGTTFGFGGVSSQGNGRTPISGSNGLNFTTLNPNQNDPDNPKLVGLAFDADDRVTAAAITVLSRTNTSASVTGFAQFSDGSSVSVTDTVSEGGSDLPGDDTFFGFTATPTQVANNVFITEFRVETTEGSFLQTDDLGFITAPAPVIPEPASLALLGVGGLLLPRRRHRA